MSDSIYRVTEVIGTSPTSWEDAAKNAVETAAKSLRDLRVGEVVRLDMTIEDGSVTNYRARVNISFKYEHE
jgi:flavin-binding protein dodecin